jgi:hypothetical protein
MAQVKGIGPRSSATRRLKIGFGAALCVVALAFAAQFFLRRVLDADYLEARFAAALSEASGGLYRIEIGDLQFSFLKRFLSATDVRLFPDSSVLRDTARAMAPEGLYSVVAPEVSVRGAGLRALLSGRIEAASLRLVRPHLHLALDSRRKRASDTLGVEEQLFEGVRMPDTSFHERLARQLPRMSIGELRIDSAAFSWERRVGRKQISDSVGNIFVELDGIDTGPASAADTTRVLFSDDARFRVSSYAKMTADSIYLIAVDSVSGSTRAGRLSIIGVIVAPIHSDSQLKIRWTQQTTRYRVNAAHISLNSIRLRSIFESGEIGVGSMTVLRPELEVYLDRTLVPRAQRTESVLPHRSLQKVSWNLRLDTIRIEGGRIAYSERANDGVRPGTIRFEDFSGELRDLSNLGDDRGTRSSLHMSTRINGEGTLVADMDYDMSTRGLNMSYRGSISPMSATLFNEVLENLSGVQIRRGMIDTAWFSIGVSSDSASGQLQLNYHDLSIAFQNKDTGRRSLFDKLKSFVANAVRVRDSNPASDARAATVATIALRRPPDMPFFGFIWVSLRQGLMETLGM